MGCLFNRDFDIHPYTWFERQEAAQNDNQLISVKIQSVLLIFSELCINQT